MPRPVAHLANLDLNLLVALRELLRERSVTRAAERLGVTQPAASAALSRLRRHFGDELLVRDRGEYTLTALGAQLAEQADTVCTAAERLFAASADFDPVTSEREFTLVMADYTIVVMGEALSQVIARAAPRTRLHIRLVRESLSAEYADGIRFIDGMVAPPTHGFALPDTRSAELFRDRWVCLVDARNPALDAGRLGLEDLARLPWVAPYYRSPPNPSAAPIMHQLELLDIRPRIAVRVESYLAVPHFVAGTDRIALMQERLAARLADRMDLRVLECPGQPEPIAEALWWHRQYEDDTAHAWLRRLVVETARRLLAGEAGDKAGDKAAGTAGRAAGDGRLRCRPPPAPGRRIPELKGGLAGHDRADHGDAGHDRQERAHREQEHRAITHSPHLFLSEVERASQREGPWRLPASTIRLASGTPLTRC